MEDRIVQWAEDGSAFTALADGCRSDWPAILRTGRGARGCVCVRALHGIEEMMAIMDKILKIA